MAEMTQQEAIRHLSEVITNTARLYYWSEYNRHNTGDLDLLKEAVKVLEAELEWQYAAREKVEEWIKMWTSRAKKPRVGVMFNDEDLANAKIAAYSGVLDMFPVRPKPKPQPIPKYWGAEL
jgi:flagellar motility protein MotE (MotC chaperone)